MLPPLPAWTGDAVAACPDDLTTRLAVLVHACGEGFLYSLRFPGETAFAAAAAAAYLNAPPDASRESVRRTLHRLGVHGAQVYAAARAAVCAAKHDDAGTREASAFWSAMRTALAEGDCYSLAQLQVNGTDVMEAGVRPGRCLLYTSYALPSAFSVICRAATCSRCCSREFRSLWRPSRRVSRPLSRSRLHSASIVFYDVER